MTEPQHDGYPNVEGPDPFTDPEMKARMDAELLRLEPRTQTQWTAAELMATSFPPPRFAVPGLIPEGLTILGGKPKLGKSWLTLGMGVAVATGGRVLSTREVEQGDVLYLALEDSPRRLKGRLGMILEPGQAAPANLSIHTGWRRLDDGGDKDLTAWLDEHTTARLVIVDTLQRVRGRAPGRDRYAEDYEAWGKLQELAIRHCVAIVAVAHMRKDDQAEDWIDSISGSTGITGAVDTIAAIFRERGAMDATLRITGRDLTDETDLALSFNQGLWTELGQADEYRLSTERAAIIRAVRDLGGEARVGDVANLLDKTVAATSKLINALADDGQLHPVKRGVYRLPSYTDPVETGDTVETTPIF